LAARRCHRGAVTDRGRGDHRGLEPLRRAPLRRGLRMSRNGPLALAFHALFIAFVLAPIVIVCAVAFTPEGYLSLPTHGLSLRCFGRVWDYPEFVRALRDSLWLAALSSTIAVLFSVPAALAIARYSFTGRE